MSLYCGVDLHSTNCYLSIINKELKLVMQTRLDNELGAVLAALAPHREEIEGVVVESTFNWYWLVDGLMAEGYRLHLANTNQAQQYKGLKYSDDRHDARWLAVMLALGILPEGYIYPREERPLRDLCRRRAFLVNKRSSMLISMRGVFESWTGQSLRRNDVVKWTEEDLGRVLTDPSVRLAASCLLKPIATMTEQIGVLERTVLAAAKVREEFVRLETVWGVGRILGLTIMYEVGEISRFPRVGDFASYCRLVGTTHLSDGKRKGRGNRKNGNPYLSWAFTEAAHFAERHRPPAKRFVQRKKAATKNALLANRALAHKLARASYYVLRDRVDFDPEKAFR